MALTYTPHPDLGKSCPDFSLPAVDGKTYGLQDFSKHKPLLIMFICNHCPYVVAIEDRLLDIGHELKAKGIPVVAICSNDADAYPEDSFENLKKRWQQKEYPFPYLVDETQAVAKNFGAVCTPDFFVYDKNLQLAYRGRMDDSWKDPAKVTQQDLLNAILLLDQTGQAPSEQIPSMGCSIKWKNFDKL